MRRIDVWDMLKDGISKEEIAKKIFKELREKEGIPTAILNVCAKALEKQIPKKVKKVRHETILGYAVTVHCPVCGGSVWQNADESKYCFRCGQKLDWEVKE